MTAFQHITVATTAVGFVMPVGWTAYRAILTLETGQIRIAEHASSELSAAAGGHVMDIGDQVTIEGAEAVKDFRAIRTGSTSGVLAVTLESL